MVQIKCPAFCMDIKNFNLKSYEHKISYRMNTFLYLWHFPHAVFHAQQVQSTNIWKEKNSILPDQYLFTVIRGRNEWLLQWHFIAYFQSIRQLFWKSYVSLESIMNGKENEKGWILLAWDLFIWELHFFHLAKLLQVMQHGWAVQWMMKHLSPPSWFRLVT